MHGNEDLAFSKLVDRHISDFNLVEEFVGTTEEKLVVEKAREDIQIKIGLISEYLVFWKTRFNCQQDISHATAMSIKAARRGSDFVVQPAVLSVDAAHERLRCVASILF